MRLLTFNFSELIISLTKYEKIFHYKHIQITQRLLRVSLYRGNINKYYFELIQTKRPTDN